MCRDLVVLGVLDRVLDPLGDPGLLAPDGVGIAAAPRHLAQHHLVVEARLEQVGDQCVHLPVAAVAHHEAVIVVKQRKPLRQRFDRIAQQIESIAIIHVDVRALGHGPVLIAFMFQSLFNASCNCFNCFSGPCHA